MTNDGERTACCGLCCGDCIPSNRPLFDAVAALREELDRCQFEEYARYKSRGDPAFGGYETFRKVLDAIPGLQCSKTCSHGGGRPDCSIRACAQGKGMEGCWQCAGSETCALLEPLSAGHGDTVPHNLQAIRELGVEHWACQRGKHYVWSRTSGGRHGCASLNGKPHRVDFELMPWQAPAPGVRVKVCEHHGSRLRLAQFTKEFVEADWCIKGHRGYVLEGVLEVDFRDRQEIFVAGDGLFIPPGQENGHMARAITNSVMVVLAEEDRMSPV